MQALLGQFNAVPGVTGTLVCSPEGRLVASAFPPGFDEALLADVARALAESAAGLATITGGVRMLDLRHASARIVARPVVGATLLFLCSPSMNLQPLEISVSVAAPRLERLVAQRGALGRAPGTAAAPAAPAGSLQALMEKINAIIARRRLDAFTTRGEIAIRAGFGLGLIGPETPDDPEKLSRLEAAASAVLGDIP